MQDQKLNKKTVRNSIIALLPLVFILGAFAWCSANSPVRDSPEEYEKFQRLFDQEELLGKTKDEVRGLLGYPDGWKKSNTGVGFPEGFEPWDDEIHKFTYSTKNETHASSLVLYFSDDNLVEQVRLSRRITGEQNAEYFLQGTESKYH